MNAGGRPKWIAFLDDDDEFLPDHLRKLVEHAEATDADVVYPWFELNVGGRVDNAKGDNLLLVNGKPAFGQRFDAAALDAHNYIPVTVLVRTDKFIEVGGFPAVTNVAWPFQACEARGVWQRLRAPGRVFASWGARR